MRRFGWVGLALGLCSMEAHGKPKRGLVTFGTTMDPEYIRINGKAADICPLDYPWPLNNYSSCCKYFWNTHNQDQLLKGEDGPNSCPGGQITKCPALKCRKNPDTGVPCPEGFPFPLREGCCKKRTKLADNDKLDLHLGCDGERWTPHDKRGQCCPGTDFVEVKVCKEGSRTCKQRPDQCTGSPLIAYRVDTGSIPKGYTQPSVNTSMNYTDAQADCKSQGMQLMMPKTEDEYLMMMTIASRNQLQFWTGLTNPNLVSCTNGECNRLLAWSDENGTTFKYEAYHTRDILADGPWPCLRVYIGPHFNHPNIDATGDINDIYCHKIYSFVCEMECYQ